MMAYVLYRRGYCWTNPAPRVTRASTDQLEVIVCDFREAPTCAAEGTIATDADTAKDSKYS